MLNESRWDQLVEQFRRENYRLFQLASQSVFTVALQAGLSALKTPYPFKQILLLILMLLLLRICSFMNFYLVGTMNIFHHKFIHPPKLMIILRINCPIPARQEKPT